MNIGLYQSAASLSSLERWQDAVAQNITSSQVTGYKKRTVEFTSLPMGEIQGNPRGKAGSGEAALFPKASYGINFQAGETQPTRRELDVALQGEGFLQVQLPDGKVGYTRTGEFHIKPDRTLVTRSGLPVMTEAGNPITLIQDGGELGITLDGSVSQGTNQLGKLAVFKFPDNSHLIPVSGGVFISPEGAPDAVKVEKPEILQGFLESSNVTPLREMVALVQIARAYEANQKILSNRDQMLSKTLESLG